MKYVIRVLEFYCRHIKILVFLNSLIRYLRFYNSHWLEYKIVQ